MAIVISSARTNVVLGLYQYFGHLHGTQVPRKGKMLNSIAPQVLRLSWPGPLMPVCRY